MMNQLKTIFFLGILSAILVAVGGMIGGLKCAMGFLIFSLLMDFFQYFNSANLVIRSTGAFPIPEREAPELHRMVRQLAERAEIPMPALYMMQTPQPNAFATGRNPENAIVVVTQGLLGALRGNELEGVLAHEISHIKNRDILISTLAAGIAGLISSIASLAQWLFIFGMGRDDQDGNGEAGFLMILLAPIAALIVQLAVSRSREYLADETAAHLTGNPKALASALLRLEEGAKRIAMQQANPSMAHMYIVQPTAEGWLKNLFSTHPSTQSRVERLQTMVL